MSTIVERFIQRNTRTSHKRWESMVMYALHYALRDVKFLSQYPVDGYFLDGYFPELKIAVEVDEPFHEQNVEKDAEREAHIKSKLGCEFVRISINSECSVYDQIDDLVAKIRNLSPKKWEIEEKIKSFRTGEYSKDKYEALLSAGAFEYIEGLCEEVEQLGIYVDHNYKEPNTRPSNGMVGFTTFFGSLAITIYTNQSLKLKVLASNFNTLDLEKAQMELEFIGPRNENSNPYWRIAGYENNPTEKEILSLLNNLLQKFPSQEPM